ncbi:MAG: glycoside hydrolase family 88 protein [Lachnospiraceae bacterium]|nr:glycoside hydrolase family 88 protein [Lachnospiraceae bacterium]
MSLTNKINKVKRALLAMQRHSWEQGVTLDAFIALGDEETAILLAKEAAYRRIKDGRVAEIGEQEAATDPCSNGAGIRYAFQKTNDLDLKIAYDGLLEWALYHAPRNKDGIVYHFVNHAVFWVDSMYMLPPFLADAGYYKEAIKQINGYLDKLLDKETNLVSHKWNETKQSFDRREFWGVGNGWAMSGLARVIDMLPKDMEQERQGLEKQALHLIQATAAYIREDGFSHDILDDPGTFVDSYFPEMLSYTIYRGVCSGWVPKEYLKVAEKCRQAANSKVDAYGLVKDSCGAPHFISPGVSPESQAFYLLMESAAQKVSEKVCK